MAYLAALGERSLGVWGLDEALTCVSRWQVHDRVGSGVWQRPFPSVYADGGVVLTAEQWAIAATLASRPRNVSGPAPHKPAAVAVLRSAARVWGMPLIDDADPVTGAAEESLHHVSLTRAAPSGALRSLTVPTDRLTPSKPLTLLRHRFALAETDQLRRPSGLWITTPLRTAIDCCSALTAEAAVCLLDHCLRTRLVTLEELVEQVTLRRGTRGGRRFAQAVALADGRSESPAESLARLLLLPHLPALVPQVQVWDRHGELLARLDLADKAVRLAVEADGKRGHAGAHMVARDRARDRRIEKYGWWTERVSWFDLRRRQAATVARVMARHRQLSQQAA